MNREDLSKISEVVSSFAALNSTGQGFRKGQRSDGIMFEKLTIE